MRAETVMAAQERTHIVPQTMAYSSTCKLWTGRPPTQAMRTPECLRMFIAEKPRPCVSLSSLERSRTIAVEAASKALASLLMTTPRKIKDNAMSEGTWQASHSIPDSSTLPAMPIRITGFLPRESNMPAPMKTWENSMATLPAENTLLVFAAARKTTWPLSAQWAEPDQSLLDFRTGEHLLNAVILVPSGHLPLSGSGGGQTTVVRKKAIIKLMLPICRKH
mmetsp:Transcript_1704/g.5586  ORF Transcript_1704/g.5586 Transcript_1704/m.5586 type:complete len:221 (-) Transcript_1704:19-681(-)